MPFRSTAQQRFAFGTDQPWAKRWADETDFAKLPKRVRRLAKRRRKDAGVAGLAIPPTGPNALFNQPGVESRRAKRLKRRRKDYDPIARLEAYVSSPAYTPDGADALAQQIPALPRLKGKQLAPGITQIKGNLCNVHGKYGPCDEALSGGKGKKPKGPKAKKPVKTPEQRLAERQAQHDKNRADTLRKLNIAPDGQEALAALRAGGQADENAIKHGGFEAAGLVERGRDGAYRLTSSGRAMLSAADAGDVGRAGATIGSASDRTAARGERVAASSERKRQAQARREQAAARRQKRAAARAKRTTTKAETYGGTKRSNLDDSIFAGPDRSFPIKTAQDVRDAVMSLGRTKHDKAAVKRGIIRRARAIGATDALPDSWKTEKAANTFTVFKDARGVDRWLAITTTAYEDRDQEIISTKAIGRAVAIGDASGQRGPLRYWHVPGLDIGDCDYQAQGGPGGRFLIESGTFRTPAYARLGAAMATKGYQMSPGFVHPRTQPRNGIFDDIAIFERSPVPAGRASNLFTRLLTKEDRMLTKEKEAELSTLLADQPDLLSALLARVERTDKAAQETNVAYKDAPDWAQALITRIDGIEATVKAMAPASMEQAADTEMADAEAEQADDGTTEPEGDENMLNPAEIQAIADACAKACVAAMGPMLDMEKKMAGYANDIKSAMAGYTAQKDDAHAKLAERVATVEKEVKTLAVGDLPQSIVDSVLAGARGGVFRPSEAQATTMSEQQAATVKEALTNVPAGLSGPEADAYKLIWG